MEGRVARWEEMGGRIMALVNSAVALKEDLQVELGRDSSKDHENEGNFQEVPVLVSEEPLQQSQLPPPPLPQQMPPPTASPSRVASATHLGGGSSSSRERYMPMLDAILKNQETLRMVLMNQESLKNVVEKLLKTLANIEERIYAIEKEMNLVTQFTQELNQVENEANWG